MKASPHTPKSRMPRWLQIVAGVACLAVLTLVVMVLVRWPYRRATVTESLQQRFSSTIEVGNYHLVFFPSPGFVADRLVLRRIGSGNAPPLATIARLTAHGSYATIFFAPGRIQTLRVEGLRVQIPPAGSGGQSSSNAKKNRNSTTVVEHLIADGSQLDITNKPGEAPLHFDIPRLRLANISARHAMSFSTTIIEPFLKGEIHADGDLGPLERENPGKIPVSATYKIDRADLGKFDPLSGMLASSGNFKGALEKITIGGNIDVHDFRVKHDHPIHLITSYQAIVNATNGDVTLNHVAAKFDRTAIFSDGNIAGKPKVASLNFAVDGGRIQDLMSIFVADTPPMNGTITLKATAALPSNDQPFLKRLRMDGDFGIGGGKFTKPETRHNVDAFSERASEKKPPKDDPNPPPVISDVKGHAVVKNGVATFTGLSFSVPGATAMLNGTFNLTNTRIQLAGNLHMDQDVSHATTGFKSVLLKPFIPLFKKKNKTSVMPIQISGTFDHPVIGPDLMAKLK